MPSKCDGCGANNSVEARTYENLNGVFLRCKVCGQELKVGSTELISTGITLDEKVIHYEELVSEYINTKGRLVEFRKYLSDVKESVKPIERRRRILDGVITKYDELFNDVRGTTDEKM